MAKKYFWEIDEALTNDEGEETGEIFTHKIELRCSKISGYANITIDGTSFNISEKPFSLGGTEQMFRLGEMMAMLSFPKKGCPTISINGECIAPSK